MNALLAGIEDQYNTMRSFENEKHGNIRGINATRSFVEEEHRKTQEMIEMGNAKISRQIKSLENKVDMLMARSAQK